MLAFAVRCAAVALMTGEVTNVSLGLLMTQLAPLAVIRMVLLRRERRLLGLQHS